MEVQLSGKYQNVYVIDMTLILEKFWGAITTAWGVVLWFFLPGSPVTSTFLTEKEKQSAIDRVLTNGTGLESKIWSWDQVG